MDNQGGDSLLWGLDDLFYCHVKLLAEDVHSLLMPCEVQSVALLPPENRPVQFVKCTGRVVSIFRLGKRFIIRIDDTTGVIECDVWEQDESKVIGRQRLVLGCLVVIFGRVRWYKSQLHIRLTSLEVCNDPNAEVLWWIETRELRNSVYSSPADLLQHGHGADKRSGESQQAEVISSLDKTALQLLKYIRRMARTDPKGANWNQIIGDKELAFGCGRFTAGSSEFVLRMQAALALLRMEGLVFCMDQEPLVNENFSAIFDSDLHSAIVRVIRQNSPTINEKDEGENGQTKDENRIDADRSLEFRTALEYSRNLVDEEGNANQYGDTSQSLIIEKLREMFKGSKLNMGRVQNALEYLLEAGVIYEVRRGSYRLVDKR
ncbi:hypothetical protein NDN08_002202 [Rhodosorus marinus]|uniref:CST complex subunit STN1 n=1 Tax=Rhodosorus marinus TaxID=101924 RepID=A0AAV8UXH0_9RHOD|nr:hypothetical protein NDN08_002202 [Rhodosorus marinus]